MNISDIGVVVSGGGMTCAYSCGALHAIAVQYPQFKPRLVIGASGSAGTAAYFVAGQIAVGRNIWCKHLAGTKFINWKRWPVLNLDYLVNAVFRRFEPLRAGCIKTSATELLIPVTDTETGRTRYVSNREQGFDVFAALMAAKAIPVLSGGVRYLENQGFRSYVDGDIAQQLKQHVRVARQHRCERLLIIDSSKRYSLLMRYLLQLYYIVALPGIKAAISRGLQEHYKDIRSDNQTLILRPSQQLSMGMLSTNAAKLTAAYELGYRDAKNDPRLRAWLSEATDSAIVAGPYDNLPQQQAGAVRF